MIHLRIISPGGRVRPACQERGAWNEPTSPNLPKVTCKECQFRGSELEKQRQAAVDAISRQPSG